MPTKTLMVRSFVRQALPFIFGSTRKSLAFQRQSVTLLNKASGHTVHLRIQKHEYGKLSSTPLSTSKSEMDGQRCFTTSIRATHVDDAGSIDSPLMQSMENKFASTDQETSKCRISHRKGFLWGWSACQASAYIIGYVGWKDWVIELAVLASIPVFMSGLINNALELNYLIAFIMGWDIKLALFLAPILASVPLSIDVVSPAFEGQSAVNRQRMVYKAIWEELQSTVHAVDQMTTRTPDEASAGK